jgi:creatinine deaminase
MLASEKQIKTAPTTSPSEFDLTNIKHAIFQGELGLSEGGVPIGAALVRKDGVVIGVGRNRRVQQGSATKHGEVSFGIDLCASK